MSVKDRVIFVPRGPRGSTGAQGPAGDPSVESARINDAYNVDPPNNAVFVNEIYGNDANTGKGTNTAVATMKQAIDLCRSFGFNYVNVMSDITMDYRIPIDNMTGQIFIRGRNDDNSSVQSRKLIVSDSTNYSTSRPGSFAVNCNMTIRFEGIDLELSTSKGYGLLEVGVAYLQAYFTNFTVTKIGSGSARIIHTGTGSVSARFANYTINPSAEGHIFSGVGAGENPNDQFYYFSNLNSA